MSSRNHFAVGRVGDAANVRGLRYAAYRLPRGDVPNIQREITRVANRLPSGEKATEQTSLICFPIVSDSSPVFTAHNFAASSSPPVTSVLPSGEKATAQIPSACPFNDPISCHVVISQNFTCRSKLPVAS